MPNSVFIFESAKTVTKPNNVVMISKEMKAIQQVGLRNLILELRDKDEVEQRLPLPKSL